MTQKEANQCIIFVAVIILILVIEILGSYCNRHAEEHREKEWKRFEEWHNNIMAGNTGINWDAR
jgi:Na+-transporting methylmalonyl-CoA/oxaloacetate decarboxylase gamma subunit